MPQVRERILKFTGQWDFTLDAKGRVNIPARIREVIEMYDVKNLILRLVQLSGFACIRVYPVSYYNERILGKLQDYEGETAEETFRIMQLTMTSQPAKVDGQNRLNIPDDLLKKLQISKDVRFVGMGDFFDIWDPGVHEQFYAAQMAALENGKRARESGQAASPNR